MDANAPLRPLLPELLGGGVTLDLDSRTSIRIDKALGSGAYGSVVRVELSRVSVGGEDEASAAKTGRKSKKRKKVITVQQDIAAKFILRTSAGQKDIHREIAGLSLDCRYLAKLIEYFPKVRIPCPAGLNTKNHPSCAVLLMEQAQHGSLAEYLKSDYLLEAEVAGAFVQVLLGLEYLHEKKIVHRDLKPQNILVYGRRDFDLLSAGEQCLQQIRLRTLQLKVSDFGLAREEVSAGGTGLVGTRGYIAPELFGAECSAAQPSADIYSAGQVFLKMLDIKEDPRDQVHLSACAAALLKTMVHTQKEQRWSASQILEHEFFSFDKLKEDRKKPISLDWLKLQKSGRRKWVRNSGGEGPPSLRFPFLTEKQVASAYMTAAKKLLGNKHLNFVMVIAAEWAGSCGELREDVTVQAILEHVFEPSKHLPQSTVSDRDSEEAEEEEEESASSPKNRSCGDSDNEGHGSSSAKGKDESGADSDEDADAPQGEDEESEEPGSDPKSDRESSASDSDDHQNQVQESSSADAESGDAKGFCGNLWRQLFRNRPA